MFNPFGFLKSKPTEAQQSNGWGANSFSLASLTNLWDTLSNKFFKKVGNNTVITPEVGYALAAYWLAVKAISEDIAKLPINVVRVNSLTKEKKIVENTPLQQIFKNGFNPEVDAMTGFETMIQWALTFGNSYCEIQKNSVGQMRWYLIHPSRVQVTRAKSGRLQYNVTLSSELDPRGRIKGQKTRQLPPEKIWHFKGLGNGIMGLSVGEIAAQSTHISLSAQNFTSSFFDNNLSIGAMLETPISLKADQKDAIRKDWKNKFGGSSKAGEFPILDKGFKFNRIQMNSTDAELLNTRQFQVEEIARWFRIPPHKLMDMSKSTFNNVEQQDINYSTDTLTPWIRRLEVQLKFRFQPNDNTQVDIDEKALVRGDISARTTLYKELFLMGAINSGTIAMLEGLPKPTNGQIYYIPLNLAPVDTNLESKQLENEAKKKAIEEPPKAPEPITAPSPEPAQIEESPEDEPAEQKGIPQENAIAVYLPTMKDSLLRLVRKEFYSHETAEKKGPVQMQEHLNKFYIKFEAELKDCLQLHCNYLCQILQREKMTEEQIKDLSVKVCHLDKDSESEAHTDKLIDYLLTEVAQLEDLPELNEVRTGDDGKTYRNTLSGWKPCEII